MSKSCPHRGRVAWTLVIAACVLGGPACQTQRTKPAAQPPTSAPPKPPHLPFPSRPALPALAAGETWHYDKGVAKKTTIAEARAAKLLDVDLSDTWAPFIFQDSSGGDPAIDPPKPNAYRETFVALANDRVNEGGLALRPGEHNYLEVFGIPSTPSVLAARVEEDVAPAREACVDAVDRVGLEQWTGNVIFLDRDRSKREHTEALRDADWIQKELVARSTPPGADGGLTGEAGAPAAPPAGWKPPSRDEVLAALRADPKARGRVDRYLRGQARLRAVRAMQARLVCEGLLTPRSRFVDGQYDLPSHEALATWERKHDIFGWGFLGGETLGALLAPTRGLALDAWKRVLAERVSDAAGIVEDGSINQARKRNPPTYKDEAGVAHVVPDLIGEHVGALMTAVGVATPEELVAFLRAHKAGLPTLHIAFAPPPLPAYYNIGPPKGFPNPPRGTPAGKARRRPDPPFHKWRCPSRSIAATSGTTCRSTSAGAPSSSAATTTRT